MASPCPEQPPARRPSFKHAQSTTIHNKRRPRHSQPHIQASSASIQENGSSVVETLDLSLPLSRRIERFSSLLEVSIQEALEQLQCLQADLSTDDEELTDDDIEEEEEEEEDEDTLYSSWSCDEQDDAQHKQRRHSLNNAGPPHVRIDGQYRAKRDAIVLQAFLQEVYTLLSGIRSEIHEQLPALLRFSSLSPVAGNSLASKPTCQSSSSPSSSPSSSITERTKESQQAMLEAFSHNYAKAQELLSHLSLYSPLSISLPEFPSTLASLSSAARASLASGSQSARSMVRHASVSGSQSAINMVRTASASISSPRISGSPATESESTEASTSRDSSSLSSDTCTASKATTSPSFPSNQTPSFTLPRPPISALRTFLSSESARLSSKLPARPSDFFNDLHLPSAVSDAIDTASHFVHDEKERLKGYVVDEAEKLKLALQAGATRLLEFHELPHDWKNNKYILSGYRFIPADRPGKLLLSAVQWHNESISIHTHLLPAAYIIYYIFFVFPTTPLGDPQINTFYDRAANLTFLIASLSCLLLSAIWHLAAGCGTFSVFRSCATLDYLGISALISSSILSLTHAAFRCYPATDLAYNTATCIFGALGLWLPWKPFFNERKYKNFRISFFLLLAGVGAAPVVHLCILFGVRATWHFYTPVLYSLIAYKIGLLFYALDFPEKLRPGGFFDTIAHSHQFWHCAIVLAIYLHWSALKHTSEAGLSGYSCMGKDPYEVQYFVRWIHRNRGEL